METKKKILIIDGEKEFSTTLKGMLDSEGFSTFICDNGKKAKYTISFEYFDCIICDVNLPGGYDGLDMLSYAREKLKDVPFILTAAYAKEVHYEIAEKLKANSVLIKPFNKNAIMNVIRREVLKVPELSEEQTPSFVSVTQDDESFNRLSINNFVSGSEVQFDVYIRLAASRYVKIVNKGEAIGVDRVKSYQDKGVTHLYLKSEDFKKYLGINVELSKLVKTRNDIQKIKKINLVKHASELITEFAYHSGIDNDIVDNAKAVFETSFDVLTDMKDGQSILDLLKSGGDSRYAHQIGVSFFSVLMARAVGWNCPRTLHKLTLAGLLHDIGEKEIPKEVLEKKRPDLTSEELKLIETHPIRSAEILSSYDSIPGEVIQVALQHHEDCTGTGYPYKIRKSQISQMTRLISVADAFCELALKDNVGRVSMTEAVYRIQALYAQKLDPQFVTALVSLLGVKGNKLTNAVA